MPRPASKPVRPRRHALGLAALALALMAAPPLSAAETKIMPGFFVIVPSGWDVAIEDEHNLGIM